MLFRSPSGLLFNSGPFAVFNGQNTVIVDNLFTAVPNSFTWSIQFAGIGASGQAGLPIYDPPTVGSSFDDFWQRDASGNWVTIRYPGGNPPGNFAARVTAVPEASTLYYALLGGLIFAGYHAFRRRAVQDS